MKPQTIRSFAVFLICVEVAQASASAISRPDSIDVFLRDQMRRRQIPGLQVAIVRRGKIALLRAYGLANVEHSVRTTNQTVFPIASMTKAFTGAAIVKLAEEGKIDISAPVSRYLDGLPAPWRPVTIRQLLIHTSGIPNVLDTSAGRLVVENDPDAAMSKVRRLAMEFEPGTRFSYNQTNYVLLGKLVEKSSGEPFARFIKERQFKVANMTRSSFDDLLDVIPRRAQPYTYFRRVGSETVRGTRLKHVYFEMPSLLFPNGGINTTAEELARWIVTLQKGKIFASKVSLRTLWTPGVLNDGKPHGFNDLVNGWALGWPAMIRPEHRAVGGTGAGWAAFFVYPDDDLAIVMLTNLEGANPETWIDELAGYYLPEMRASAGFGLPPTFKDLRAKILRYGLAPALQRARTAHARLPEGEVNQWGYRLLGYGRLKDAVEVFRFNAGSYPGSANAYDSLGEAYEALGSRTLAIRNYELSLRLSPKNTNAVEHLRKLKRLGR